MNKKFIEDAKEKFPDLLLKEVTLESEVGKKKQEELIKEERLTGGIVVVARKGKVVHFGTYGKRDLENNLPVEKDTIFRIYSMTKAITSVAALM